MERVSRTQRDPLTFLVDPDRNDYYLEGFWQSERFFIDSADKVREEFTLREPLRGHNAELAARMAEVPSVSLHVRRGDYFAKAKFRRSFGVPLTDYYHRAMIFQAERIASPHFFVFSDDHDWVRANLHFDHPATFIQGNAAEKSYLDLVLMSRCKNHIIANSSFSWWGAWLDPNPEKVVTAPTPWFLKKWMITPGIVPEQWHEIPAF